MLDYQHHTHFACRALCAGGYREKGICEDSSLWTSLSIGPATVSMPHMRPLFALPRRLSNWTMPRWGCWNDFSDSPMRSPYPADYQSSWPSKVQDKRECARKQSSSPSKPSLRQYMTVKRVIMRCGSCSLPWPLPVNWLNLRRKYDTMPIVV
jgi:hypothetical protein